MIIVDLVLLVVLASFVMNGIKHGFIQTLGNFVGAILGFLAGRAWSPWLGGVLGTFFPGRTGLVQFVAFVIIFLIVDRVIGILFRIADGILKIITMLPFISSINKLLGGILGFAEGLVLVGSSIYIILHFRLDPTLVSWLSSSTVASWTQTAFMRTLGFLL